MHCMRQVTQLGTLPRNQVSLPPGASYLGMLKKNFFLACQVCANMNSSRASSCFISAYLITFPPQSQVLELTHRRYSRKYLWPITQQMGRSFIHSFTYVRNKELSISSHASRSPSLLGVRCVLSFNHKSSPARRQP